MQAALRPMNLGEILDHTFAIYRKNTLLFVGIAALPAAIMLAIHGLDIGWVHTDRLIDAADATQGGRIALSWFLAYGYYHISGFVTLLFLPAFVRLASCEVFGENATIVSSFRCARPNDDRCTAWCTPQARRAKLCLSSHSRPST